ncbi:hypothetical protein N9B82_03490 [Saprospiraceae bacterium]|nr:hypothetical protein [Saprospiraceae bacterium]
MEQSKKKRSCLIILLIAPFILLGCYYLFLYSIAYQFGEAIGKAGEKISSQSTIKRAEKSQRNLYENILGAKKISNFTGIKKLEDTVWINTLSIIAIDSVQISYRIESQINWKSKPNIEGIAKIDSNSIRNSSWNIQTKEGNTNSAYRFLDKRDDCILEILVSKIAFHKANAMIYQTCRTNEEKLTVLMRNK